MALKQTNISKKQKSSKSFRAELFDVSVMVFVASSVMAYAFIDLVGFDVTEIQTPIEHNEHLLQDEISGVTYERLIAAILLGIIGMLIYLAISFFAKKYHLLHVDHMIVVTNATVWTSIALIAFQERYHFIGLEEFSAAGIINLNFWLMFASLLVLFFGLLFNAGFEHRIAYQNKKTIWLSRYWRTRC